MVNQTSEDEQHLRLLSIFHYVVGALAALFALFPFIHLTIGWFLVHAPTPAGQQHDGPPLAMIGWLFVLFGAVFFLAGESMAACVVAAGRFIRSRHRYWFVFVMACLECAFFPFGTLLGVFTIIVLSRPSVKKMFGMASTNSESIRPTAAGRLSGLAGRSDLWLHMTSILDYNLNSLVASFQLAPLPLGSDVLFKYANT